MKLMLFVLALLLVKISAAQFDEQTSIQIGEEVYTVSYSKPGVPFFIASNSQVEKLLFLDNAQQNNCGIIQGSNGFNAVLNIDRPLSIVGNGEAWLIEIYLPVLIKKENENSMSIEMLVR